ncbi:MAG: diphthamide biosynthesis enzyme Dph2 [Nanoarchaeota archaeon]|nr:diphthamide biosynthesis enzyme Dph2 [Nanoarchaeota archaeon]
MALTYDLDKLLDELKVHGPKKVLLQLPEGLKPKALEIAEAIEGIGIRVIVSGEPCWGGCALAADEASNLNADLIVHFGHAEFKKDYPAIYVHVADDTKIKSLLKKSMSKLKRFKRLGISCSIDHLGKSQQVYEFYSAEGKDAILSEKAGRATCKGHIIGCDYSGMKAIQPKVDAFVVIGNNFHSKGAALALNKPVFLLDTQNRKVTKMNRDKFLKQKAIAIDRVKNAEKLGIIISTSQRFGDDKELAQELKAMGKKAMIISLTEITPDKLANFNNLEGFIILACPRLADDIQQFGRPMITYNEAMVAMGRKSWEDMLKEGFT